MPELPIGRTYNIEPLAVGKALRDASNVQISFIPIEIFFHLSIDSTYKVHGTGHIFGWRKFLDITSYKILRFFRFIGAFLRSCTILQNSSDIQIFIF